MDKEKILVVWQYSILFLSVYVLIAISAETLFVFSEKTLSILISIDTLICFIFIIDFICRLIFSKNKILYLKRGWIDLVSSIPYIAVLRLGRIVAIFRIIRVLRGLRSSKHLVLFFSEKRFGGTLVTIVIIMVITLIFSSIAILNFEKDSQSNIKNVGDALWWSIATITTVGYGDLVPVTTLGRIVASLIIMIGVGLFGTFAAVTASTLIQKDFKKEFEKDKEILDKLDKISENLERIDMKLKKQ